MPKFRDDEVSAAAVSKAMGPRFTLLVVIFIFFGLSTIFADQMLIFGSVSLTKGVNRGIDALDFVQTTFTDLTNYGNNLTTDGNDIDYNLGQAAGIGCTQATTLQGYLPQYFGYVDDYLSYVEPVPDKCDDASNGLQKYGVHYKNASVWVLYGTILVGVALYSLGMICKSKLTLKIGIGITELLMLVLFLVVGVQMVIVVSVITIHKLSCWECSNSLLWLYW
ncbi:hypothetical protein EON64_02150 [archaeon]|nr:MAG: hypothetical protein EON64_02150 [archaeon]